MVGTSNRPFLPNDVGSEINSKQNPYQLEPNSSDLGRTADSRHSLGVTSAASIVAASMIGAGVYTTSGFTIGSLQSPTWVLAAWAVAGCIALCGAICYGALAKAFSESGGEYLFLSKTVHPIAGLMAGWVSLLAGFTAPIAFAATTFESYLSQSPWMVQRPWPATMQASLLVIVAAMAHTIGLKRGARVQDFAVLIKLAMIGLFLVIAFASVGSWPGMQTEVTDQMNATTAGAESAPSHFAFALAFASSLMWISLSYSGFNAAVYVASEVRDPQRNVPRALMLGTVLVTVIYLLLNSVFVFAPHLATIANEPNVATVAAAAVSQGFPSESWLGGGRLTEWVRLLILCGLFTSVSALVMTGPRVYAKMASDGFLPRWMNFQGSVPIVGIWLQAVAAIAVIQVAKLKQLLEYLGLTLAVSAALTASVVFVLHRKSDSLVRVPLYPLPPIVFVGGTLLTATFTAIRSPWSAGVTLATLLVGATMYPWYRRRHLNEGSEDAGAI